MLAEKTNRIRRMTGGVQLLKTVITDRKLLTVVENLVDVINLAPGITLGPEIPLRDGGAVGMIKMVESKDDLLSWFLAKNGGQGLNLDQHGGINVRGNQGVDILDAVPLWPKQVRMAVEGQRIL